LAAPGVARAGHWPGGGGHLAGPGGDFSQALSLSLRPTWPFTRQPEPQWQWWPRRGYPDSAAPGPAHGRPQAAARAPGDLTRLADVHTIIPSRPRYDIVKYTVEKPDTLSPSPASST